MICPDPGRRREQLKRESTNRNGSHHRRGTTILETVVCAVVLAALFSVVGPTVKLIGWQLQESDHRSVAMNELVNVADRLTAEGRMLSDSGSLVIELSDSCRRQLVDVQLEAEPIGFDEEDRPVELSDAFYQQVTLTISWAPRRGDRRLQCRLVCWIHPGDQRS